MVSSMASTGVRCFFFLVIGVFQVGCSNSPISYETKAFTIEDGRQRMNRIVNEHRDDVIWLSNFFEKMPKGGDIHHHLTGSIHPQDLLSLRVDYSAYIYDEAKRSVLRRPVGNYVDRSKPDGKVLSSILDDESFQLSVLDAWTMEGADKDVLSSSDHFFNTFSKFKSITQDHPSRVLSRIRAIAKADKVGYLETMVRNSTVQRRANELASGLNFGESAGGEEFERSYRLLFDQGFEEIVEENIRLLESVLSDSNSELNCEESNAEPGCDVLVRFQTYAIRLLPNSVVFSQLMLAFETVNRSDLVVGVNMVAREDSESSLENYSEQMRMVAFFRAKFPNVKVSLHAGELVDSLVGSSNMTFHMTEAIKLAGVDRVGHGLSLLSETDHLELLQSMANDKRVVEVLLSSNNQIFQFDLDRHPLPVYLAAGVPVVLATDDLGILNTSMTEQFVLAVHHFDVVDYIMIRTMLHNSLEYSFLSGDSLWVDGDYNHVRSSCLGSFMEVSLACKKQLTSSEKMSTQWKLEKALRAFEVDVLFEKDRLH